MTDTIQGELDIQDTGGGVTRISLNGDNAHIFAGGHGQDSDIVLVDKYSQERIRIGRAKLGKPPNERWVWAVNIMNSSGKRMAMLNEEGDLYLGGKGADGDIEVFDKDDKVRISIGGDEQRISVKDKNKTDRILLLAEKGIEVYQIGLNRAGYFHIDNSDNKQAAIEATTNGLGDGVKGSAVADYKSGVYGVTTNKLAYGVSGRIEEHVASGRIEKMEEQCFGALGARALETREVATIGESMPAGVYGRSKSLAGCGVIGVGWSGVTGLSFSGDGIGVAGWSYSDLETGVGVSAYSVKGTALLAVSAAGAQNVSYVSTLAPGDALAGYFHGPVFIDGSTSILNDLSVSGSKNFLIDHPIDPENKYLVHSSVESADRLNIYSGEARLDEKGETIVQLPDWFGALNTKFQYQLTSIGQPAPNLYIAAEVSDNRFKIAGGHPNMKVSWQITGIRQDAYAKAHPLELEMEKQKTLRGKYLQPIEHGKSEDMGIAYERKKKLGQRHNRF